MLLYIMYVVDNFIIKFIKFLVYNNTFYYYTIYT